MAPKINLTHGWTAASLAPKTVANEVAASSSPMFTSPNPNPGVGQVPTMVKPATAVLRQAALGYDPSQGPSAVPGMSASAYSHADVPAFLQDAIANLNSSPGFAQSNLTNVLLQRILGGAQTQQALAEFQADAQRAIAAHNLAAAKAQTALDNHQAELTRYGVQGPVGPALNANPAPAGTSLSNPAMNSSWNIINSGWNSPATTFYQGAYNAAQASRGNLAPGGGNGGYAPGTVNGVY